MPKHAKTNRGLERALRKTGFTHSPDKQNQRVKNLSTMPYSNDVGHDHGCYCAGPVQGTARPRVDTQLLKICKRCNARSRRKSEWGYIRRSAVYRDMGR